MDLGFSFGVIFAVLMPFASMASAQLSSNHPTAIWNCSFTIAATEDPCSITIKDNPDVFWYITTPDRKLDDPFERYLRASLNNPGLTQGASTNFALPIGNILTSGQGILSFQYLFNSNASTGTNGSYEVRVCKGEDPYFLQAVAGWAAKEIPFNCTNETEVEISFRAIRGDHVTNVGIYNITIIENPYKDNIEEYGQSTSSSFSKYVRALATKLPSLEGTNIQTVLDQTVSSLSIIFPLTSTSAVKLTATANAEIQKENPVQVLVIASSVVSVATVCLLCVVIIVFIRRRHRRLFSKQANDVNIPTVITEVDPERPSPMYDTSLLQFRSNGHDEDDNDKQPEYTEMEALSDKDPYQTLTSRPLPSPMYDTSLLQFRSNGHDEDDNDKQADYTEIEGLSDKDPYQTLTSRPLPSLYQDLKT